MKGVRHAVFALGVVALLGGAGHTQGRTAPALDKLVQDFMAAFNAKDAAKVASLYAQDAVLMPPNHPMVKGRAEIEAYWKGGFDQGLSNLQLKPMESAIAGSQAYEAGTAVLTLKPGGSGSPVTESSKYVVIYKRVGTDWKLAYDIFNSDEPAPSPK